MTTKIIYDVIDTAAVTAIAGASGVKVSSIVYPGIETATNTAGGETINLTGSGFQSTPNIIVGGTSASVVTFISSTQISFTAPPMAAGTYVIYVVNPDGGTAISIPGISYHGVPQWTTAAGSLGSVYEYSSISNTVVATSTDTVSYSLVSGTLPTGSTLNSSTGLISGTSPAETNSTTFSFVIGAADAENQVTTRSFSLTINPDVVTWNSPSSGSTYSSYTNSAIANVTMSATSAAGQSITYTANSLPTGLSITGANIAGTPTVAGSSSTLLTATAANTGKTATNTINWVISIANDTYFPYVSLLLNGENATTSYVSDASTNNFALSVTGSATPNRFSPLWGNGYYGVSFDGSSGMYLTIAANSAFDFNTADYTVEGWIYLTSSAAGPYTIFSAGSNSAAANGLGIYCKSLKLQLGAGTGSVYLTQSNTISVSTWTHFALVRQSGTTTLYVNGTSVASTSSSYSWNPGATYNAYIGQWIDATSFTWFGYISNLRVVKGTALYTSAFTPSTSPLTAISGTTLLTCQNNNFTDNSTNAFTITPNGTVKVVPNQPFGALPSGVNNYGSSLFDGSTGYLTTNGSTLSLGTGDFTIEAWVYQPVVNSNNGIFQLSGTSGGFQGNQTTNIALAWNSTGWTIYAANSNPYTTGALQAGTWYHVALVRQSGYTKFYVNGVSQGGTILNATTGFADSTNYTGTYLEIGGYYSTSYLANMYVSNFRIVKGTAVYTSNFTPPTTPLTAIANTSLLTLQNKQGINNNIFYDDSSSNLAITRYGSVTQGALSPFTDNWSLYTDGSASYAYVPYSSTRALGTGDFSIECFVNIIKQPADYTRIWSHQGNYGYSGNVGIELAFSTVDTIMQTIIDGNSTSYYYANLTSGPSAWKNTWAHVVVTRQSGTLRIFLNGMLQGVATGATQNINGTAPTSFGTNAQLGGDLTQMYLSNFRICTGSVPTSYQTSSTTTGTTIFTTPTTTLTTSSQGASNVTLLLFTTNRFLDASINNFAVTTVSNPQIVKYSPFSHVITTPTNYSGYFRSNTSNDRLTFPSSSAYDLSGGTWTIEFWMYPTSTLTTCRFLLFGSNGSQQAYYIILNSDGSISANIPYTSVTGVSTSAGAYTLNTWTHVALVCNAGSAIFYVNGVVKSSAITITLPTSGAVPLYIGYDTAYGGQYNGYLSNLRVVKGTAVYTGAFTTPTNSLTAIANTSILTLQSNMFGDTSSNAAVATLTGAPLISTFNPFNTPTVSTYISYDPSTFGGSMYFNGTSDYLQAPTGPAFQFAGNFTIEAWVYSFTATGGSAYNTIFDTRATNTSSTTGIIYNLNPSGYLNFYINGTNYASGTPLGAYTWTHAALVRNGSTITLYQNGVPVASTSYATSLSSGYAWIGSVAGTNSSAYWNGYISNLRVVNGVAIYTSSFMPSMAPLTSTPQTSLLLLGTNGGIIDKGSKNDLVSVVASVANATYKYGSGSLAFNNSTAYLLVPPTINLEFGSSDFTIEFWWYPTVTTRQALYHGSFGTDFSIAIDYNGTGTNKMGIWASSNGTSWNLINADSGGNGVGTTTPTQNSWNHIAYVRSGTTWMLFVNGNRDLNLTGLSGSIISRVSSQKAIGVWWNTTAMGMASGYIDDLRITKGYARYTTAFTPPSSAFITR